MMEPAILLQRLEEIGKSLEDSGRALALIGLGSVGLELARLDAWSDLDFFAVVETGYKQFYLQDLGWLTDIAPAAYYFRNTPDGFKFLFADGIFCEFAVFEPSELQTAAYAPGRLVWKQPQVPETWSYQANPLTQPEKHNPAWLLGEALTNLYIGLGRELRGEKLTAHRFIQNYAVDRVLELMESLVIPQSSNRDLFDINRRFELRFPAFSPHLSAMLQGYTRNRESALAILAFLEANFEIPPVMASAIRERALT
jgi:hypothetical protein